MNILDRCLRAVRMILPKPQENGGRSPLSRPMTRILSVLGLAPAFVALGMMLGESNFVLDVLAEAFSFIGALLHAFAWMHSYFIV